MKFISAAVAAGLTTTALAAAPVQAAEPDRGDLISAVHLKAFSRAQAVRLLKGEGFDTKSVRYGIDTYRLVYRTIDPHGKPTKASGLLVLPRNKNRKLRTVSYGHGTTNYKLDAPSMTDDGFDLGAPITYGSAGFAAVAPDYIGLGKSPGAPAWKNVPSEAGSSLDLLRAAKAFVPRKGRKLDRTVYATGFSQGASAALGLARELQSGADRRFRIGAVAPVSGAYAMRTAEIPALIGGKLQPKLSVAYSAYLLVSWNRIHHLYDSPAEVFKAPYASKVEKLFDGTTPGEVMIGTLPDTVDDLLTPRGFEMLRKPSGRFAEALRADESMCRDWTPRVPVRLFDVKGDEQVVNANTQACAAWLRERGVTPKVTRFRTAAYDGSRHLGSNLKATASIVRWFAAL